MTKNIERIALVVTIAIVFLVSVTDLLGLLDQYDWFAKRIPTITLLLLTVFVGYWISEQNKECDKLDSIEKLASLSGVGVRALENTEEALGYLAQRFIEADHAIDQIATAPSLGPPLIYRKYDEALAKVLKKNVIKYRHIVVLDVTRWKRVRTFLLNPSIQKYYVSYYDAQQGGLPGLSYAVIDNCEVVVRYPYTPEQSELWLSIKHPDIVRLFVDYAQSLLSQGTRLEAGNTSQIEEFDRRYGIR
jgi:hypothetical protein